MTGKHPLFSILIPVYNVEKYLRECVESVINQTFDDYEVIMIDDGSTDQSSAICDEYAQKYERIAAFHQKNKGLMMARKEGILRACGQYCLFLDSDDYYDIHLLEEAEKYITAYDLDILIFNLAEVYKSKVCTSSMGAVTFEVIERREAISRFLATNHYTSIVKKVIRRDMVLPLVEDVYIPLNYSEDALQTAYFLTVAQKIGVLDKPLYYYRRRASSLIHSMSAEGILEVQSAAQRVLACFEERNLLAESDKKAFYKKLLNTYMDKIYRLNSVPMAMSDHVKKLDYLRKDTSFISLMEKENRKGIVVYNRVRAFLLLKRKYTLLLLIDKVLNEIQKKINYLQKKDSYE